VSSRKVAAVSSSACRASPAARRRRSAASAGTDLEPPSPRFVRHWHLPRKRPAPSEPPVSGLRGRPFRRCTRRQGRQSRILRGPARGAGPERTRKAPSRAPPVARAIGPATYSSRDREPPFSRRRPRARAGRGVCSCLRPQRPRSAEGRARRRCSRTRRPRAAMAARPSAPPAACHRTGRPSLPADEAPPLLAAGHRALGTAVWTAAGEQPAEVLLRRADGGRARAGPGDPRRIGEAARGPAAMGGVPQRASPPGRCTATSCARGRRRWRRPGSAPPPRATLPNPSASWCGATPVRAATISTRCWTR
jgi:hypothetical protein